MSSKKGRCMLDVATEWGQHAEQRLRSKNSKLLGNTFPC